MSDLGFTPPEPESNPVSAPDETSATEPTGAPGFVSEPWDSPSQTGAPTSLFQSWSQPEIVPPTRIPHLGHLFMLATLGVIGFACAAVLMLVALHFHLLGVTTMTAAATEIHYMLGTEAAIYLVTLALSLIVFPMFWNRSFFDGIQWRWAAALRLGWRLPVMAAGCFALAGIDETLLPGPANAPIDEIFRAPGAAWLMFAFGVTLAPFFEELIFRGFLLPALATAWDWVGERFSHEPPRPLDSDGQPQWSLPAMVAASIATSLPFALVHVEQQGHSLGPFLLLIVVSLILCAVRLRTRSLAASTLVHACYNFLIFSLMLIGTGGFRHLD